MDLSPAPPVPQWARDALSEVFDPCCRDKGISVVDMGLLRSVGLTDVQEAIAAQPGVDSAEVEIVWDEAWTTDRLSDSAVAKLRFLPDPTAVPDRDAYIATHRTKIEEAS
jgi:metal-sulfur cluster biosynthetic enzyme